MDASDRTLIDTCLRKMHEEIGIAPTAVQFLGILRCDWVAIQALTSIAVTPVVGYVGFVLCLFCPLTTLITRVFYANFSFLRLTSLKKELGLWVEWDLSLPFCDDDIGDEILDCDC